MFPKTNITTLRDPIRTIGDDKPYYSCFYEKVPEQYKLRNLIKEDPAFPYTAAVLPQLISEADIEFTGWEIMGRTFEDFGARVKHEYRMNADNLEEYIAKKKELKVALSSITKITVGAGHTRVESDTMSTNNSKTDHTTESDNKIIRDLQVEGTMTGKNHTDNKGTNESSGETTEGEVGYGAKGESDDYTPAKYTTNKSNGKTSSTSDGTNSTENKSSTYGNDTTSNHTTDNSETDGSTHTIGSTETETKEHTTETETITPGVAIEQLARIPGIVSVEKYFIEMLKPCFTLYRWYNW